MGHRRGDDAGLERLAFGLVLEPGFGDHHQALLAAGRVRYAEHGHAALAYARQVADCLLEVVGVEVAAGADDELLRPASDVELAVGEVGMVASHQPAVVEQGGARRRVAVIAGGG